jgi:osmotically-inducible protein OsmY
VAITVKGEGGTVRLLGVVDSSVQSDAVAEVARSVEGVASVDNQLRAAAASGSRYRREG